MAIALPSSWKGILPIHYKHFVYSIIIALVTLVIFCFISIKLPSFISGIAFFSGSLVVVRMVLWIIQRAASPLTYKFYLIWSVHLAAGLFAIILSFIETNSQEILVNLKEGEKSTFAKFNIHYLKNENYAIDNYLVGKVILRIEKENIKIAQLEPQIRYYPVEKSQTSESSVYHNGFYDLYAVINEITKEGNVGIKIYFKPLISWLWFICFVIFTCGILIFFNVRSKLNEKKV
jgi:cytochrome c-type biogenesis protein CcmF